MSSVDNHTSPNVPINSVESSVQTNKTMADPTNQQQTNRNVSKRTKEGDDSFESEHRGVNVPISYFNLASADQSGASSAPPRSKQSRETPRRPSFPPFRITFESDIKPSELSILKAINKHCQISLSHGRYSSFDKKNHFLLYANSIEQYERLLDKNIWPAKICDLEFFLNIPSKVPTAFSIVALGIPAQWDIHEFECDVKKQYPTILKVDRLFVKGGIPISKVRIDFSSNRELSNILKNKRILLDEENTSYSIQPYTPPMKILRCYNCQQYNEHVAANCPHKDAPVCFRCGQNHAFDPSCRNNICCAHCKGDHLTGSPNCQVKIEERRKRIAATQPATKHSHVLPQQQRQLPSSPAWPTQQQHRHPAISASAWNQSTGQGGPNSSTVNFALSSKIDQILVKVDEFSSEQSRISTNMEKLIQNYNACRDELHSIKSFLRETVTPYLCELSEAILYKTKSTDKVKFRESYQRLKDILQGQVKTYPAFTQSTISSSSLTSSPHESPSQAV